MSADRRAAEFAATIEREAELLIPRAARAGRRPGDPRQPGALGAGRRRVPRDPSDHLHPMFPLSGGDPSGEGGDWIGRDATERERFEQSWLSIARRWGVELEDVHGLHHRTTEPTLIFTTEEIVGDQVLPPAWRCVGPLLSLHPLPALSNHRSSTRASEPPATAGPSCSAWSSPRWPGSLCASWSRPVAAA